MRSDPPLSPPAPHSLPSPRRSGRPATAPSSALRRLLVPALPWLLAACASAPPGASGPGASPGAAAGPNAAEAEAAPASAPAAEPAAEPTAGEIDDSRFAADFVADVRYRHATALDELAAGEGSAAEERLIHAVADLTEMARVCAGTRGCDPSPYLDALSGLALDQAERLAVELESLRDLRAEVAAGEVEVPAEEASSPFVTALPELGDTVALLDGTDLRELITLNGPVKAALDDWLTWLRPELLEAWRNYTFLRDRIAPLYAEADLPEALLFGIIATESGGKAHAYSRAGAAGLLQFMRATGRIYGLGEVDGFDQRLDPVAATRANVAYVNHLLDRLGRSLEKALAAYNGGEGRIERLHRQVGRVGFWDPRLYYALPRETRDYVPRVLAAAWLFLHPEEYRLEWPAVETATTRLVLRRDSSLSELTLCLGQEENPYGWFRVLRNLNPRIGPGDRLEAGAELEVPVTVAELYPERCLEGELLARARELHEANYPEGSQLVTYVVRRGDTLGRIAARYPCVGTGELAAINGIRAPRYVIRIGQVIKIPPCR